MKRTGIILALIFSISTLALFGCGGGDSGAAPQVSPPGAPSGVSAIAGARAVTLSWDDGRGATSYNIYWSTSSGVTKATGTKIEGVSSPHRHDNLAPNRAYYYVVTGVNSGGESAESSQVIALPTTIGASPARRINADTPASHENPIVVYNNAGDGLAVWKVNSGSGCRLLCSHYSRTSGTWFPEATLDSISCSEEYDLATDGSTFMVVWEMGRWIKANITSDGINWTWPAAYTVSSNTDSSAVPRIASNGSGYLVTWESSYRDIFVRIYNGSAWEAPAQINPVLGQYDYAYNPSVASNGTGYAVAWGQQGSIYARIYSGSSWGVPALLENSTVYAGRPSIASNGTNYAVAWIQNDGWYSSVYANINDGTGWWADPYLVESFSGNAAEVSVASTGATYAFVWKQDDIAAGEENIYLREYSPAGGGSWSSLVLLDAEPGAAHSPDIAPYGSNYAVVWIQDDGESESVYGYIKSRTVLVLESGVGAASEPSIVSNGTGYTALWRQYDGSFDNIFFNTYASGSWSIEGSLVQGTYRSTSMNPNMATDDTGVTMAVWEQYVNGVRNIFGNVYSDNAWGTPIRLAEHGRDPAISTNGTDFMITWLQRESTDSFAQYVYTRTVSGGTPLPRVIGDPVQVSGNTYEFQVATNGTGYAVLWRSEDNIYVNIHDGSSWQDPSSLPPLGGVSGWIFSGEQISSNGSGYAVAWSQWNDATSTHDIYANVYDGSSWGTATLLEAYNAGSASSPRITSNGTGYAVAWQLYDGSSIRIYANVHDGMGWQEPSTLQPISSEEVSTFQIGSDGSGYLVAYIVYDGTDDNVVANRFDGSNWTGEISLESLPESAATENILIASNGAGYAVAWAHYNIDYYYDLYANVYDGTSWSGETLLDNAVGDVMEDDVALLVSDGRGYGIAWLQDDGSYNSVYANAYSGGEWGTAALLEEGDGWVNNLVMTVNNGYNALWTQEDPAEDPLAINDIQAVVGF